MERRRPFLPPSIANILQSSSGFRTKFLEPLMRFTSGDMREPYRFIQNRAGISVVALKSSTAAEKSKDQLSRDFPGRSIFDFCNNICHEPTLGRGCMRC